jgi:hypothetical protein
LRSQNCAKHPISGLRSASNYGRPLVCFLISEIIFPPIDPIVSFLISDISAGRRQQKNVMHAILPTAVIANADMSAYYHSVHAPHSVPFEPNCQLCFGCKRNSGRIICLSIKIPFFFKGFRTLFTNTGVVKLASVAVASIILRFFVCRIKKKGGRMEEFQSPTSGLHSTSNINNRPDFGHFGLDATSIRDARD